MKQKGRILIMGNLGFPFGNATSSRKLQLGLMFTQIGNSVLVLNRFSIHSYNVVKEQNIKILGIYRGIKYIHCSILRFRPNNFILRNIFKIIGCLNEFLIILISKITNKNLTIITDTIYIRDLNYIIFLCKILKIKLIYDYLEIVSSLGKRSGHLNKLGENSFDVLVVKRVKNFIAISPKLNDYLGNSLNVCYLPPIIFTEKEIPVLERSNYILYCGSISYIDSIDYIVNQFLESRCVLMNVKLILVLHGNHKNIAELKNRLNKNANLIEIKLNLHYAELLEMNRNAIALLMPLSSNVQDEFRFPFKFIEYLTSNSVIITNNYGIVKNYLVDNVNALIADDSASFSDKLNYLIENPNAIERISLNARNLYNQKFLPELFLGDLKQFETKLK